MEPSTSKKTKAILFARVSSKDQEETGYSLDAQEKMLKKYADDNHFSIVKTYRISESASGKQVRKLFNEMLAYAIKNKIPVILCEKIDRLTRNPKDAATISDWLQADETRYIHFVKENFIVNRNTRAHENLVWDMKVAIARFYTSNLSEEVKKGQKEKIAQGWMPTKPALGYKTIGESGHKIHVPDGEDENGTLTGKAAHIRRMFELYASGNYSISRLEVELYETGMRSRTGRKLGMSSIHRFLSDVFYIGKIRWMKQVYPGKHNPLVSKDLFDKVQVILRRQLKNPHFAKHNALLKSKVFCSNCTGMLTWYEKKGHWYGHCNNHGEYAKCEKKTCIREDRVEEQFAYIFDVVAPKNEEVLQEIENILREDHGQKAAEREREVARINGLLQSTRTQKDKYYEAKINREVSLDYCERKIAECTEEEEALEAALVRLGNKNDEDLQLGLAVHELAYKSKEIYEQATVDEQRLLMSQLFTNLIQKERKIELDLTLAALFLEKWVPKLNEDYELRKSLALQGQSVVLATQTSIQLHYTTKSEPTSSD